MRIEQTTTATRMFIQSPDGCQYFFQVDVWRSFGTSTFMEKRRGRKTLARQLLVGVAAIVGVATLYFFPPAEHSFYPRCIFHSLTGLDCPGCGSLRAMHQLLHGNFRGAFQLNAGFVIALPLLGIFALYRMLRSGNER